MSSVLVISPLSSHPPQTGARRRINTLLKALKRQGHKIHYVYTACEAVDVERMCELMRSDWDSVDVFPSGSEFRKSKGEDYGLDDWINPETGPALAELAQRYEITHCLVNYVFQTGYLKHLPAEIPRILDTHDKLSRRHLFEEMGIEPGFYYTTEEEERRGLTRADVVLSIQDNEVDYFRQAGKPVAVIGHPAPVSFVDKRYTKLSRLGYVGAHNKFNIHALEQMIPAFAAYVERSGAALELSIAGNVARFFESKPGFQFPCIRYEGYLEDLGGYFEGIDLYVNPTLQGTGLKIKSVEALSYGVPIVSTSTGWDGLPAEPGFHDAKSIDDLIGIIEGIRKRGFEVLTKLSNFSKAVFSEYQLNLESNLSRLFDGSKQEVTARAAAHPHYIGNLQTLNPDFVTLDQVDVAPSAEAVPHIAHVVNPVRMPKTSDLYIAQPMAFRAMRFAQGATRSARVTLAARRFAEDEGYLEDCFDINLPLSRSAQDLDSLQDARKLPLLNGVFSLDGLPADATHVVYTNSDIGVQPHFYEFVSKRIAEGYDALVINRRTMSKRFSRADEMPEICAEAGRDHPGFDCFVVSREVLEKCYFGDTLVGVHLIGRVIFWNLLAHSRKIGYHDACQLTFHIGDDVPSKGRSTLPYIRHNLQQGVKVARHLQSDPGQFNAPERLHSFDRVLQVAPGKIQGSYDPQAEPRNKIFLHSFFRTGSTYIFQKVRHCRNWGSFYEPFHEDLALFSPEKIDEFRARHANSTFRHASQADDRKGWLFAEFEPLLDPGVRGVRNYDRRMSYLQEFEGADQAIRDYIAALIETSDRENLFFQFNRTALRQRLFKRLFAGDTHIYLQRGVRNMWGSYLSFQNEDVYGFLRNNLAVTCFNMQQPLMQELAKHVPAAPVNFMYFFHNAFSKVFDRFTLEHHYLIHATFWYAAQAQAKASADFIIDLDRVGRDRLHRLETEAYLATHRMNVSFGDICCKGYSGNSLGLPPQRLDELEMLAREIVETVESGRSGAAVDIDALSSEHLATYRALDQLKSQELTGYRRNLMSQRDRILSEKPEAPKVNFSKTYRGRFIEEQGLLLYGFHRNEGRHIWGSGSFCMIRFQLPEVVDTKLSMRMHVHPLMAQRYQGAVIYLNGEPVVEKILEGRMTTHVFEVPRRLLVDTAGLLEIGLAMPRFYEGARYKKRQLSLCLSEIRVTPTNAVATPRLDDQTPVRLFERG